MINPLTTLTLICITLKTIIMFNQNFNNWYESNEEEILCDISDLNHLLGRDLNAEEKNDYIQWKYNQSHND